MKEADLTKAEKLLLELFLEMPELITELADRVEKSYQKRIDEASKFGAKELYAFIADHNKKCAERSNENGE